MNFSNHKEVMNLVCVKKVFFSIRDIILSVIILYMAEILGMMAGALLYEVMPRNDLSQYLYIIISTAVYIALIWWFLKIYERKVLHIDPQNQRLFSFNNFMNIGIVILVELIYIAVTVLLVVFTCPGQWMIAPENRINLNLFRAFVDFGVGAGIAEEMVFRNTMLKALKKRFNAGVSIGITSLVFSLLHIPNITSLKDVSVTLSLTMILGIVLCLIRLKTGTLLAPMAFHALWNSVFLGIINIGAKTGSDTIITYVTESPLGDLIPLVTGLLLLFVIKKLDLKKELDNRKIHSVLSMDKAVRR